MSNTRKLWLGLATLLVVSFGVLLWAGTEIFRTAPPMPEKVLSESGQVIYTRADMEKGRQVWQSIGGMQLGSIWGHGGYVAPDWSADWLHRESVALLDLWARADGGMATYAQLPEEQQAALRSRLKTVPAPVCTPQPSGAASTAARSAGTLTVLRSWASAYVAKLDWPKNLPYTGAPARESPVLPSSRRPEVLRACCEWQYAGCPAAHCAHDPQLSKVRQTWSPGARPRTWTPTASTTPAPS